MISTLSHRSTRWLPVLAAHCAAVGCSISPAPATSELGFGDEILETVPVSTPETVPIRTPEDVSISTPVAVSMSALDAFPNTAADSIFKVLDGPGRGKPLHIIRQAPDAANRWIISRYLGDDDEPIREDTLTLGDDGSILMLQTLDRDHHVISSYDPPLVIAPAVLEPGQVYEQHVTLIVHPASDPSRTRVKGPATNQITLISKQPVSIGSGVVIAWRVRTRFTAQLKIAHATAETESWFVPGMGLVAERYHERTTVLGVPVSRGRHLIRLDESQETTTLRR